MKRILVTGSVGQIGSELTMLLRELYGNDNVVAGGNRTKPTGRLLESGPFEIVDCTDAQKVADVVKKYEKPKVEMDYGKPSRYKIDREFKYEKILTDLNTLMKFLLKIK